MYIEREVESLAQPSVTHNHIYHSFTAPHLELEALKVLTTADHGKLMVRLRVVVGMLWPTFGFWRQLSFDVPRVQLP